MNATGHDDLAVSVKDFKLFFFFQEKKMSLLVYGALSELF